MARTVPLAASSRQNANARRSQTFVTASAASASDALRPAATRSEGSNASTSAYAARSCSSSCEESSRRTCSATTRSTTGSSPRGAKPLRWIPTQRSLSTEPISSASCSPYPRSWSATPRTNELKARGGRSRQASARDPASRAWSACAKTIDRRRDLNIEGSVDERADPLADPLHVEAEVGVVLFRRAVPLQEPPRYADRQQPCRAVRERGRDLRGCRPFVDRLDEHHLGGRSGLARDRLRVERDERRRVEDRCVDPVERRERPGQERPRGE